ncbi:hypothetical protein [Mucisphaera calidilacus]|uniref:Uncharacterized protein n=1 Tax=Mucisphaera calidilacus TaxID=2527982 RepID=A0A518C015_9BACT|nr:hypothetical protein [Mucisphaera calidilacus]QDU72564.1 hypothetical protein Pan265_24340 [Mucisphaera calidilacus]
MVEHLDITTNPRKLADMIALDAQEGHGWAPSELATIFKHQLASPLLVDLCDFDPVGAEEARMLALRSEPPITSFTDLLTHAEPPVGLLDQVKKLAKAMMNHLDSVMPRELAVTLYYLAIANAMVKAETRLSSLSDGELKQGLVWAASQSWLDEDYRATLSAAAVKLDSK